MKEKNLSRADFINNALYEFRGGMARRFYYTNEEYPYIPYYYNPEDDCLHADAVSVPFGYKEEEITDEVIWDTLVLLEKSLKDYFFHQKGITLYEYD